MQRSFGTGTRRKRIYVPPRISRTEGQFPTLRGEPPSIIDISTMSVDPSAPIKFRSSKPHLSDHSGGPESSNEKLGSPAHMRSSIDSYHARNLGKSSLKESPIKSFDAEKEIPLNTVDDRLRLKKFRWMPNPFLANNDLRQGGPLFYAKYFQDRDRRVDEKFVRDELARHSDALAGEESGSDSENTKQDTKRKRKKAVWKNYRPVSVKEVQMIPDLSRIAKILVNELHIVKVSNTDERSWVFPELEKRLSGIIFAETFEADKKSVIALVKCIYQFGIYGKLSPIVLNKCLDLTIHEAKHVKPENLIYVIETLARLRFRDQRCLHILESLALCWPGVRKTPHMLIKAANGISRLDLYSSTRSDLSAILGEALPSLTRTQLEKIKAITACTMFDDVMLLDYLVLCHQANIEYVRHLLIVFLYIRSRKELVDKIPKSTQEWIESNVAKDTARKQLQRTTGAQAFSSPLHEDIHRIVVQLKLEAVVASDCGPFTFDLFLPSRNAVIEACSDFQFYVRTAKVTADARLRHQLIRSLGFKLIPVTQFQWNSCKSDGERANYISAQLGSVS